MRCRPCGHAERCGKAGSAPNSPAERLGAIDTLHDGLEVHEDPPAPGTFVLPGFPIVLATSRGDSLEKVRVVPGGEGDSWKQMP